MISLTKEDWDRLEEEDPQLVSEIDALICMEQSPLIQYWFNEPGKGGMSPIQKELHLNPYQYRFARWANKLGKTYATSWEMWSILLGTHPIWSQEIPQPCTILYVVSNLGQSYADDVCRRLRELQPEGILSHSTKYDTISGYRVSGRLGILAANGSNVMFRSGTQDGEALAGISAHFVIINEPPRRERWGEIMRAAAEFNAPVLMTFTPIDSHSVSRDVRWLRKIIDEDDSYWWESHKALIPEHAPHRESVDIATQIKQCAPWERAQRIEADWEGPSLTRYFMGFDDGCIIDIDQTGEYGVGLAFDHGELPGHEVCVLYLYTLTKPHHVIITDCYYSRGRTTPEQDAVEVQKMLYNHNIDLMEVDRAVGDINSAGKGTMGTVNQLFEQAFAKLTDNTYPPFRVRPASKGPGSVLRGANVLNMAFLDKRLLIHTRNKQLIHDFRNWGGTKSGTDADKTHAIDAARYALEPLLDIRVKETRKIRVV